jgi:hypothetical protein
MSGLIFRLKLPGIILMPRSPSAYKNEKRDGIHHRVFFISCAGLVIYRAR